MQRCHACRLCLNIYRIALPGAQAAVTVANVGQLAADLLISTLGLRHVAYLEDQNVLPCSGHDAFTEGRGEVVTALELFSDSSLGLFVLQQRAPVIGGRQREFAAHLADWLQDAGFAEVRFLGCSVECWKRE